MFFPMITNAGGAGTGAPKRLYVAFNERAPHRYLSDESTAAFRVAGVYPSFVIGRIVEVAAMTASDTHNPYLLELGTTYFVLTVSAVEWGASTLVR